MGLCFRTKDKASSIVRCCSCIR